MYGGRDKGPIRIINQAEARPQRKCRWQRTREKDARREGGGRRIGFVAVCGSRVCGHDRTSPPVFTRYHRKSMIVRFNEIPLSPSCLYARLPPRFLYAREPASVPRVSRYIVFGIDDAKESREKAALRQEMSKISGDLSFNRYIRDAPRQRLVTHSLIDSKPMFFAISFILLLTQLDICSILSLNSIPLTIHKLTS